MGLILFLESSGGLAVLYTVQGALFSMMLYILAAEFWRTRDQSLLYKLAAASAITAISGGTAVIYIMESLYGIKAGQRFFPLVFNMLFSSMCSPLQGLLPATSLWIESGLSCLLTAA